VNLYKIKRPGGIFSYDVQVLVEDEYGVWLYAPKGSSWKAPHDEGALPFGVLLLLSKDSYWVAWWVDDPADRRLEIDVCLRPERVHDGWTYVDLELDPVRHGSGVVEIQDEDEFETARSNGSMTEDDAEIATTTSLRMAEVLRLHREPFGNEGWRRLASISKKGPDVSFPIS